jgi:hypothetical protein
MRTVFESLTKAEFYDLFERMRHLVNFKGATSATEIEKRMLLSVWLAKRKAESIVQLEELRRTLRRELGKKASEFDKEILRLKARINRALVAQKVTQNMRRAEQIDKLINADFSGGSIYYANKYPKETIAQTLLYGNKEADRRIHATQRARARVRTPEFKAALRGLRR